MNSADTNEDGWATSELRRWLNADFIARVPGDVRHLMEPVRKQTNNVDRIEKVNDVSVVSYTVDGLCLPSISEIFGMLATQPGYVLWSPATYDAEGAQYQLYADGEASVYNHECCKKDGVDSFWWLRSPSARGSGWFLLVHPDGDWGRCAANLVWGVSPCFCF